MVERIVRAIRLDWTVFREIAQDPAAMKEAAIIVAMVSFLSALGSAAGSGEFFAAFITNWTVEFFVGWIGWAILTYFIGTILFKGGTNISEMMRVLGYASAPKLIGILAIIPCFRFIAPVVGAFLALIAGIIAIREAMDFDTGDAIVTVVLAGLFALATRIVFMIVF